jgi:hypothetical protein
VLPPPSPPELAQPPVTVLPPPSPPELAQPPVTVLPPPSPPALPPPPVAALPPPLPAALASVAPLQPERNSSFSPPRPSPSARPQHTSGRVSGIPPRRQHSQVNVTLSVSRARSGAALALETTLSVETSPCPEELTRRTIESGVAPVAASALLESAQADSKPESRVLEISVERNEPASSGEWNAPTPAGTPLLDLGAPTLGTVSTFGLASEPVHAPDIRLEKGWDARRARAIGLAGLAVALLGASRLIWAGGSPASPSAEPSVDSATPSRAAAASERVSPPPPLPEPTLAAANDPSLITAAALSEGAARPNDEDLAAKDGSNGTPSLPSTAPRRREKKVLDATSAAPPPAAPPFDKATMSRALSSAVQKAEQCDLWGRATGTAQLFVTFAPSGSVSEAHLVGEPLASAAVARCILHHVRASTLPPFAGPPITVSRKITLH